MVFIAPLIGAAVFLSGLTAALPTSDYSSGSSNSYSGSSGSSDSSSNSYSGGSSNSGYDSSNSGSNYGSSNSGSYGGSNYGSSNQYSSSADNNQYTSSVDSTSSTMMMDSTSSMMMMDSTSTMMMMDTTSSTMMMETSTTSAYNSQQTSNYGSGSSYWGGSGYQDCVNQCIAQFGGSSGGSYQATATSGYGGNSGSSGSGSTHTVIVAPTKGVFRMVPFATNASVGDTIEFHWGADDHTVTKSSELTPCNKSSAAPVFASGTQNQSFVFTQVVNDTNPTFYYCGTPTHCEKGMFGIINPAMATPGAPTSLGGMMSTMAANDSDLAAYAAYSSNATASNDQAAAWGSNFDMSNLPAWSHSLFATNVLFTRNTLAMNSEVLKPDNSIDLSSVATTPLMLPKDITSNLNAASSPPTTDAATTAGATAGAAPAGAAATAPTDPSATPSPKSNGASSVASPRILVGAVVVLATIFAL